MRSDPGPELSQPRIYFGEGSTGDTPFVVVGTEDPGVGLRGLHRAVCLRRHGRHPDGQPAAARVVRVALPRCQPVDLGPDRSSTSRIMIYRDIVQRVPKPVPFLTFDQDPYFAIIEGRPVWIWDAYTTTNQYPYSQSLNLASATDGQLPPQLGQLHAELGEGGGRRLRRDHDLLREPVRPDHPGVGPRLPRSAHADRGSARRPAGALPLPREHLPDPGDAVRQLPRHRRRGLLSEAGPLGGARRPHRGSSRPPARRPVAAPVVPRRPAPRGCARTTC